MDKIKLTPEQTYILSNAQKVFHMNLIDKFINFCLDDFRIK